MRTYPAASIAELAKPASRLTALLRIGPMYDATSYFFVPAVLITYVVPRSDVPYETGGIIPETNHGLSTGIKLKYEWSGGPTTYAMVGLTFNSFYYAVNLDNDHFGLALTKEQARAGETLFFFRHPSSATLETHKFTIVEGKSIPTNPEVGWFSNGPVKGATVDIRRWISGTMPGYESRFNEQKSNLELGGLQFDLENQNGQMSKLIYEKLGANNLTNAWYRRIVEFYILEQGQSFADKLLIGTYLLKEPPNNQGLFYKFFCYDALQLVKGQIRKEEQKFTLFGKPAELSYMIGRHSGAITTPGGIPTWTPNPVPPGWTDGVFQALLDAGRGYLECVVGAVERGTRYPITAGTTANCTLSTGSAGDMTIAKVGVQLEENPKPFDESIGYGFTGPMRITDPVLPESVIYGFDQRLLDGGMEVWSSTTELTNWDVSLQTSATPF